MGKSKYLITDEGRVCTRCHKFKKWSKFYKDKSKSTGHIAFCKICHGPRTKRYKCKITAKGRECIRCRDFKEWSEFYKSKVGINGCSACCKNCDSLRQNGKPYTGKRSNCHIDDNGRTCARCKRYLNWDKYKSQSGPHGRANICIECTKYRHIEKKYGLSQEKYLSMLDAQNHSCAICGKEFIETPSVDHNHANGKVRSILCNDCNAMLGYAYDNPSILRFGAEYLERHN